MHCVEALLLTKPLYESRGGRKSVRALLDLECNIANNTIIPVSHLVSCSQPRRDAVRRAPWSALGGKLSRTKATRKRNRSENSGQARGALSIFNR